MKFFDFNSITNSDCTSPLSEQIAIVGGYAIDRDGFSIEGAKPPTFSNKATPFSIEFSHDVPAMAFPSTNEFFDVDDVWETSDVFAGRSTLRNLARCFLFPADDYYCREFVIDAGFLQGKLILQRHMDDAVAHQEEGYGIVFERAVTKGAHPEAHAYNQFLLYTVGEHSLMVRCEVDCVDAKTGRPLGVTTKKIKRKKNGQGFYPLGSANYYQEQWLQMILSGTSHLIIGSRDEGPRDVGSASIISLQSLSVEAAAASGELSKHRQQEVFDNLNKVLTWMKTCFLQEISSQGELPSQLVQAQIRFTISGGRKELVFVPVPLSQHVEMLSDNIVQGVNEFHSNATF